MLFVFGKSSARISTDPITWLCLHTTKSKDQCAGVICTRCSQRKSAGLLWASKSQPKACSGMSGPKRSAGVASLSTAISSSRITRKELSSPLLATVISKPKGGQMRARSMAKCYHRDFRERINAMPTKCTSSPRIAPLSSTGSTAAVIVTHNRVDLLRASLQQVVNQTHPVQWVIVVDNGADNAVEKLVSEVAGERAVYVPSKTNLGGAGGFALGFLTALSLGADAIWCADDDGRPADETVLKELYRVAEAN